MFRTGGPVRRQCEKASSYAAFLRFAQLALIALLIRLRSDAVKNRRPLLPVFIPLRLPRASSVSSQSGNCVIQAIPFGLKFSNDRLSVQWHLLSWKSDSNRRPLVI